jgi:hypothetical protein
MSPRPAQGFVSRLAPCILADAFLADAFLAFRQLDRTNETYPAAPLAGRYEGSTPRAGSHRR